MRARAVPVAHELDRRGDVAGAVRDEVVHRARGVELELVLLEIGHQVKKCLLFRRHFVSAAHNLNYTTKTAPKKSRVFLLRPEGTPINRIRRKYEKNDVAAVKHNVSLLQHHF